jgi:hypothetical protein
MQSITGFPKLYTLRILENYPARTTGPQQQGTIPESNDISDLACDSPIG